MGRKVSQQRLKCQDCVELYPNHDQALARDCWKGSACVRYRSLLRRRQTANLKRRKVADPIPNVELKVEHPPVAVVHLYQLPRKDSPLHAFSVEVWVDQKAVFTVGPMHTIGLTASKIQEQFEFAFRLLRSKYEIRFFDEGSMVTHPISECPIENCPCR